jgi:hypothetical protein
MKVTEIMKTTDSAVVRFAGVGIEPSQSQVVRAGKSARITEKPPVTGPSGLPRIRPASWVPKTLR